MRNPSALFATASLLSLLLSGCAGSGNRAKSPDKVVVGAKDPLYVGLPEVSDSVATGLSALGWGEGKFQTELRKEILFQFNRKGVPIVEDSASAAAFLAIRLEGYGSGKGASGYIGNARLRKAREERVIEIRKADSRAAAPERQDPTVDNIRSIAEAVVKEAWKSPTAPKPEVEVPTQMWMLF